MSFKSFIDVNVHRDVSSTSGPNQHTNPNSNPDQPSTNDKETNPHSKTQDPAKENKTDILPADQESDSSSVATIPNTGRVTYDLEPTGGGATFSRY